MHTSYKYIYLIGLLTGSNCFAGGPLILEGEDGDTPVVYQSPNITIHTEGGSLGALSNSAADTLMQEALSLWNNVSTSTINFTIDDSQITNDIDAANFQDFLPSLDGVQFHSNDGLNPVAYDSNGAIIDAFFGAGQSDFTIGVAASIFNLKGDFFIEGYAVINGKDLGLSNTEFKLLIAHEIGHFIGLDHTQVNINNQETDFGIPGICTSSTQNKYPVMYPFVCRNEETLHADDISSISALYPTTNIDDSLGVIEGRFVDEKGKAILGANIWAENTTTGDAVSIISDYLTQDNGFYKLYIKPGNYTLHANSINRLFNDGSGIGPYALSLSDKSFIAPHPLTKVTLKAENDESDAIITVLAGQTLIINLSSTGNSVILNDSSSGGSALSYIATLLLLSLMLTARQFSQSPTFMNH